MHRRGFVALLSGAGLWSLPLLAQGTKIPVIGYLAVRSPLPVDEIFFQELRRLGWVEGKNLTIERRFAAGNEEQLRKFAGELVDLKVDLIVAVASGATHASKAATSSIPIVFVNAGDPVGQGFVASLAHPGTNISGISFDASPEITGKQVQLLASVIRNPARLAAFWNPNSPFLRTYLDVARSVASGSHLDFNSIEMPDPDEWDKTFRAMVEARIDGIVVLSDSYAVFHRARIAALTEKYRIPAIYGHSQYVEAGGLMSYGSSFSDAFGRAPGYVDRILKGALISEMPVQQPTRFELIVNLREARAIELTFPPDLLAIADRVVE